MKDKRLESKWEKAARKNLNKAAPALLEALKGLFEHCSMIHTRWGDGNNARAADAAITAAKAAIAQAEGGAK